jgi:hypothetical protein
MLKEAAAARREYARKWRAKNREKVNAYMRDWKKKPENKEKVKGYTERYWTKKAEEMSARVSD